MGDVIDSPVAYDDLQKRYEALLQIVGNLPELPMKGAAVGRLLVELEVDEAVWCLDQLIRGALWGEEPAMEAMLAASHWLIQCRRNDDYRIFSSFFAAAHEAERKAVISLLRDAPAHQALLKGKKLPEVRLPLDRDTTLGERRAMAAGPRRHLLERLLYDPSPLVISKLLGNPHIRQQDVLVVATRRPTTPDLLMEIAWQTRWFQNGIVREALALNPFGPTGLALKILPTLPIKVLRMVAHSGDLHPLVLESAKQLVELREERTAPWRV